MSHDEIDDVQRKVEEVKLVITDNIDKLLDRGEKMSLLDNKTEMLSDNAYRFQVSAKGLKNRACLQDAKMKATLGSLVGVAILIVFGVVIKMSINK